MFHRSAFTLVELLLVIGIIGVLSTVLVPYLTQYQDRARDSEKRSNVETLGLALQNYMLENQTWRTNG
jgi:prepilin-type N-terminal cleavage/methylation domain-containing protein